MPILKRFCHAKKSEEYVAHFLFFYADCETCIFLPRKVSILICAMHSLVVRVFPLDSTTDRPLLVVLQCQ